MNSEQARFVLSSFRPGIDRRDAPPFAEAFERMAADPVLAEWFEREMAVDAVLRGKLREAIRPPQGLRDRILATGRVSATAPRWGWRRVMPLALAASVVLLVSLKFGLLNGPEEKRGGAPLAFAAYRAGLVQASQQGPHVTFMDSSQERIQEYLRAERAPSGFALPSHLGGSTLKGCRVLEWEGTRATLVCLHARDGGHLDLVVIEGVAWDASGPGNEPAYASVEGMNTVSWARDGRTYILAGRVPVEALRRILQG